MKLLFTLVVCFVLVGCSDQVADRPRSGPRTNSVTAPTTEKVNEETEVVAENPDMAGLSQGKYQDLNQTPIDAVRNFLEGIANGKPDQARRALVLNENVEDYMLANLAVFSAMDDFARADNEYFGEEGGMPVGLVAASLPGKIGRSKTVFIDDNHAECTVNPPLTMKVVRQSDGWKVDFTGADSEKLLEISPPIFRDTAKVFNLVRAGIVDGTISSRTAARQALQKLKAEYGL